MPWISLSVTPGALFGNTGAMEYFRPDAPSQIPVTRRVTLPDSLKIMASQSCWASDGESAYNFGGFTQNAVFTKAWQLWPLGMRAPDNVPDVVLSAGPGITSSVVCYLRGYDDKSNQRSPLSGPSATLAAANQTITYQNLGSVSLDPRWTHLEGWESRDGLLPRFVWRRQIGVATVVHGKAFGDLGEADVVTFEKPPRCRFGVFWHGRLALAGDDENPTRIYFMEIGQPEEYSGLFLDMKSRQPIVGLYQINGRLLVFGPTVTEGCSGWTEDDLKIDIVQPHLGLVSHFGLVEVDTWLFIPTQEQVFMTDGASWFPMGMAVKTTWARDFKANRAVFEAMWAEHHPDEHVVRWYVNTAASEIEQPVAENGTFVYWVADYETALPLEGGTMGQPRWTYDTHKWPPRCFALLAVPGARRADPFNGTTDGSIMRIAPDGIDTDAQKRDANDLEIISGAELHNLGGDNVHGARLVEITAFMRSELRDWVFNIYSGDIECIVFPLSTAFLNPAVPAFTRDIDASASTGLEPVWTHHFGEVNAVGRAFILHILVPDAVDVHFAGWVAAPLTPATVNRQPGRVPIEE